MDGDRPTSGSDASSIHNISKMAQDGTQATDKVSSVGNLADGAKIKTDDTLKALNSDMISKGISLLARTGNGLSMAYTKLDLREKGIASIDIMEQYPHLRYVNLSNNSIQNIEPLIHLEYILSLDLSNNQVSSIPPTFDKRKYLQQANFAKNKLTSFNLASWHMLIWLNLNENKLKDIKVTEFPSLIHLEARANSLTSTAGLKAAFHLQRVYMAQNQIEKITELDMMTHLQLLHLRDNKIDKLDGFSEFMRELTYVNLRGNKITSISEIEKLSVLPSLKHVVLTDNPIALYSKYRIHVISKLKNLEKLDKDLVTPEEREEADLMKGTSVADTEKDEER